MTAEEFKTIVSEVCYMGIKSFVFNFFNSLNSFNSSNI